MVTRVDDGRSRRSERLRATGPRLARVVLAAATLLAVGSVASSDEPTTLRPAPAAAARIGPRPAAADAGPAAASGRPAASPRAVHVVRMVPRGYAADPTMTPDAVRRAVSGASAYWSEQTRGAVSFSLASVSDWVSTDRACTDVPGLWSEAARLAPGALRDRAHLVVVAPRAAGVEGSGCDYGFGSMGSAGGGGATYVTALHPPLLAHELGHNLGLGHSGALVCDGVADGAWDRTGWSHGCEVRAYDDLFDVMGYSGEGFGGGYLDAVWMDRLGADPAGRRTLTRSGTVTLAPMSRLGAGVRTLRIAVPGEPVYHLEYRTANGRDASVVTGPWRAAPGVRVLREGPDGGSLELDASPGGWRYDRALIRGRTFTSASGRMTVRVDSMAADRAVVHVTVD